MGARVGGTGGERRNKTARKKERGVDKKKLLKNHFYFYTDEANITSNYFDLFQSVGYKYMEKHHK